jgi:hypothetical protein
LTALTKSSVTQVEADLVQEADPLNALEDAVLGLRAVAAADEVATSDHATRA